MTTFFKRLFGGGPKRTSAIPKEFVQIPTVSSQLDGLIAGIKDIDQQIKRLGELLYPNMPEWDQFLALSHRRHELSGSFTPADLSELVQLLKSSDADTRAIAAGSLIGIQKVCSSPLPDNAIKSLGSLVLDSSDNVLDCTPRLRHG